MNSDFRLSVGYFAHVKVQKLGRRLGDSGVLAHIRLLSYAAQNRPTGALTDMDADDIGIATAYAGDVADLIQTLLDLRLLDRAVDGVLELHDWAEHNPWASGAPERSGAGKKAADARWEAERERKRKLEEERNQAAPSAPAPPPQGGAHQGAMPAASSRNAETCAPHQSALPAASKRNAPFLSDSSPTPNLPHPNPTNPPDRPDGPGGGQAPPDSADTAAEAGGLGVFGEQVLGELLRFAPDEAAARAVLARHDLDAVHWQLMALEWRVANRSKALPDIACPWPYFLDSLAQSLPLPAAVRADRDAALAESDRQAKALDQRQRAEAVAVQVEMERTQRDAQKLRRAACDEAWERIDDDERQDIQAQVEEKMCAENTVWRGHRKKYGPAWTQRRDSAGPYLEYRDGMLAARGLISDEPPAPSPAEPLRLITLGDQARAAQARQPAAEAA